MKKFYFTFGTDPGFPLYDCYIVIMAESFSGAAEEFRRHYPDRHPGCLNCAFFYTEEEWQKTGMEKIYGKPCAVYKHEEMSACSEGILEVIGDIQRGVDGYGNGHSEYMVVGVNRLDFLLWMAQAVKERKFDNSIVNVSFVAGDDGSTVANFSTFEKYSPMYCPMIREQFPDARVYGFGAWDSVVFDAPEGEYATRLEECFADEGAIRIDIRITDKKSGCYCCVGDLICFADQEALAKVEEDPVYSYLYSKLTESERRRVEEQLEEVRAFWSEPN